MAITWSQQKGDVCCVLLEKEAAGVLATGATMSPWKGIPGMRWRHIEDGKNFVYIKTDWGSIVVVAFCLLAFGYWLAL